MVTLGGPNVVSICDIQGTLGTTYSQARSLPIGPRRNVDYFLLQILILWPKRDSALLELKIAKTVPWMEMDVEESIER